MGADTGLAGRMAAWWIKRRVIRPRQGIERHGRQHRLETVNRAIQPNGVNDVVHPAGHGFIHWSLFLGNAASCEGR